MIEKLLSRFPMITVMIMVQFIYFYFDKKYDMTQNIVSFRKFKKEKIRTYLVIIFVISVIIMTLIVDILNIPDVGFNSLGGVLMGIYVSLNMQMTQYLDK